MLVITQTPVAHFLFPTITNRLLEHLSLFSPSQSATLSTSAMSQPFLPLSLIICHGLVFLGCVFSLTIDLLDRETPCKRNKLVLSLTVTALLSVHFGFIWQMIMKDFVTGDVRKRWEFYFEQRVRKIAAPFVRTDSIFPWMQLRRPGVNNATGSTGVDVNNRFL